MQTHIGTTKIATHYQQIIFLGPTALSHLIFIDLPDGGPERALTLALIRQESAFDPGAISPSGARGLMQLMPGTARLMAKVKGLRYSARKLLTEPDYNIALGSGYLDRVLGGFDGSYVLALAGYNAGPGRVRKWIGEFGDPREGSVDTIDWVETIPYDETRNYVQRVLEGLQVYRWRLDRADAVLAITGDSNQERTDDADQVAACEHESDGAVAAQDCRGTEGGGQE